MGDGRVYLSFNKDYSRAEFGAADEDGVPEDLPLADTWSIWEQIQPGTSGGVDNKNYDEQTHKFANFSTIKDFWRFWDFIPQPSILLDSRRMVRENKDGSTSYVDGIMIFKENIKPTWEDPKNADGGHLQFQIKPKDVASPGQMDEYWNNLVLGVIGKTVEPYDIITGLRLVDKVNTGRSPQSATVRIELWFAKADNDERETLKKNVEEIMSTSLDGRKISPVPRSEVKPHSGFKR
ncbi:unnamed protein product [Vitrella brassicaformis CCMP3155]|uniref:Eukaryotic translation initiation factor 4E n=1 Tax=Vitrella brassicaformis (strain CCMP3155) TaxID=1169540 RepID=A0A0G4F7M8_VITBC|nr:unnamed protein product [Vitrella brassicaformis CCMP3155]|eukprot:CEM08011.1 unnamed protein product [Vitrella brassicaformis CCMP3155]